MRTLGQVSSIGSRARKFAFYCAPVIAALLTGCDDSKFTEWLYAGSQIAVEVCIKRNTTSLVDEKILKQACVKKHQYQTEPGQIFKGSTLSTESSLIFLYNTTEDKIGHINTHNCKAARRIRSIDYRGF
jgi:hypothetical protein